MALLQAISSHPVFNHCDKDGSNTVIFLAKDSWIGFALCLLTPSPVYIISTLSIPNDKNIELVTPGSRDLLLCSNDAFDAPRFNKEASPHGSTVAAHANERGPSAWFAFPKCTSSHTPRQCFFFLTLGQSEGSHVYAFVPHYSASASTDPHLAFKFPDQPGSHAPMTLLLLQLNSLCSSYSDQTRDSLEQPSRIGQLLCDTMLFYSE